MPNDEIRISSEEMRSRVNLILGEMRELTELLTHFRDRDLEGEINVGGIPIGGVRCRVGVNPIQPPQAPCDSLDRYFTWREALEAGERLLDAVLQGVKQLREATGPDTRP